MDAFIRISIHALREESDDIPAFFSATSRSFQSTLSVRRATYHYARGGNPETISIHALREESD